MVLGDVVAEQPVEVCWYVKFTDPADTPVINPALSIVAIELLLLVHIPPVVGEAVAVFPTQIFAGAVTTGNAFTVIVPAEVIVPHPPVRVTV